MSQWAVNEEGILDGVNVVTTVTVEEYIENLTKVVANAKDIKDNRERTSTKPEKKEERKFAQVINAMGLSSTRQDRLIDIGSIETEEETVPDEIKEVMKKLYTRAHPKVPGSFCGVLSNGGMTVSFSRKDELAKHVLEKFGDDWKVHVRMIKEDGERIPTNRGVEDLNKWSRTGMFTVGGISFNAYSAAMDGSCCYHSYCRMIKHTIGVMTANELKKLLYNFYNNETSNRRQRKKLEGLYAFNFRDKKREVMTPGNWGDLIDLAALASMHKLRFIVYTIQSIDNNTHMHSQTVHGISRDGQRISRPQDMERGLVFYHANSHYGIAVPVNTS